MKESSTSERLKLIMNETGLRQIDIVNKCRPYCKEFNIKLGRNDLSQYVSGKVEPNQWKLTVLSKALNVNEAWLMGYNVPVDRDSVRIEKDVVLDENHKLEEIILEKTKVLTADDKRALIKIIDTIDEVVKTKQNKDA